MPRTARLLAALLAAALLAAGCGGDDDTASTTTTTAVESSTDPSAPDGSDGASLAPFAERGPHGVGSLQLALDDGRRVVVWYPAVAGAGTEEPTDTFDIASLLSPELQAQIPADARPAYPVAAATGAEADPSAGPYPVVLFSHGFAGFPEQSVDLTTHLASWGYVVAAPDHVERSLSGLLGTAAQGVEPREDPEVLGATLDLVLAEAERDGSPLAGGGMVDGETVAVAGHSAGAGAAYRVASTDDRIDAVAAYSLGDGGDEALPAPPSVPGLVMLGTDDATIEAATTREVFAGMEAPKVLAEVDRSGHLVFSDLCLVGAEQGGLVGIVERIGLDIPDNLLRLASDGCGDGALPVTEAFPAIDAVSVAFLRAHLGDDPEAGAALVSGPVTGVGTEGIVELTVEPS